MQTLRYALMTSAAMLMPVASFAQTADTAEAAGDTALEQGTSFGGDIVVTAQRRTQSINDVGLSITAIGEEALQDRNFESPEDLAKLVPGLSVSDSGFATPIYTLRGVGINEPSVGSNSSVAVYVDEVPLGYPVLTQGATFDLQRVEVLKGPQGTLYGQNATGGAINYIANKPTDEFAFGGSATIGRFSRGSLEGYVSGPLGPTLKARLAARARFGDDWQKSITRDDEIGKIENYTGRLIVEFEPAPSVRFAFNLNGWIDRSDTIVPQLVRVVPGANGLSDPNAIAAPIPPANARLTDWDPGRDFDRDDKFWQVSLRADVDVTDAITLTSITAYADLDREQSSELDGIAVSEVLHHQQFGTIQSFSQELRVSAETDYFSLIAGANYVNDETDERLIQILSDSSQVQNIFGFKSQGGQIFGSQNIESFAVFANIDVPLTDQLTVGGGIRYSEEKRIFSGCGAVLDNDDGRAYTALANFFRSQAGLAPLANPIIGGECYSFYTTPGALATDIGDAQLLVPGFATQRLKQDNIPWNVNVNFKPTPDTLLYARVSRGFKAGNFATLNTTDSIAYQPVVQEELLAYEVGARASIGNFARMEGAIFQYDYDDKQLRARINVGPPFGNINAQDNIPSSRIKGAEFSIALQPTRGLTLAGSGVYLDSEIREYTGFTVIGSVPQDLSGSRFNFTPKWSLNGDIGYEAPVTDSLDGFIGVNVSYRSETSTVFAPPGTVGFDDFDIDGYTLVDGQLGVKSIDGRWKAFIWGKNIFNKYYVSNIIRAADVIVRYPDQPATYGLTVALDY